MPLESHDLSLFPLNTVLFPGGLLPLADKQCLLEIDGGAERPEVLYRESLVEEVSRRVRAE